MSRVSVFEELSPERGRIKKGYVRGVELADGTAVNIPVILAGGERDGPTLALTAGAHGTEIVGLEVIRRVIREHLDLKDLHGNILSIPVVNPLSIQACSYVTPQDNLDITTVFPGNPEGTITRRLAARIWETVKDVQYFIDLHCIGAPGLPFVITIPREGSIGEKALRMAKAVGLTMTKPSEETLARRSYPLEDSLAERGIPSIVIEFPYEKVMDELYVEVGVRGVLNVMKELDMLEGQFEEQEDVPILGGPILAMMQKANRGGVMLPTKIPGDTIKKGDVVARIMNVFGEEVETVTSPVDGWVMGYPVAFQRNASQALAEGDFTTFIAYEEP